LIPQLSERPFTLAAPIAALFRGEERIRPPAVSSRSCGAFARREPGDKTYLDSRGAIAFKTVRRCC
jgi:hypothetical protein